MSCGARGMTIPRGFLTDRADVYERKQAVVSQEITGNETKIASNARCRVLSEVPSPFAHLFGAFAQQGDSRAWFGKTPRIQSGYVLLVKGVRYIVRDVQRLPAEHRYTMQVATVVVDQTKHAE